MKLVHCTRVHSRGVKRQPRNEIARVRRNGLHDAVGNPSEQRKRVRFQEPRSKERRKRVSKQAFNRVGPFAGYPNVLVESMVLSVDCFVQERDGVEQAVGEVE